MTPKLSILIPTTKDRRAYLENLLKSLYTQIGEQPATTQAGRLIIHNLTDVEILVDPCERCTIGEKRNFLLQHAKGDYLCFFDDDDEPGGEYISTLMAGIASGADCVSLRGIMTIDGENPQVFEHSIKYRAYATTTNFIKYERYPNHLNCIKTRIAKRFKFPNKNYGEDTAWATKIFEAGVLKTEYYTDKILYYYKYRSKK